MLRFRELHLSLDQENQQKHSLLVDTKADILAKTVAIGRPRVSCIYFCRFFFSLVQLFLNVCEALG
jgi:hypothetical protein